MFRKRGPCFDRLGAGYTDFPQICLLTFTPYDYRG